MYIALMILKISKYSINLNDYLTNTNILVIYMKTL
jgi:hypothetical protein